MDMRFDEAGDNQFAVDVFRRRIRGNAGCDIDDTPAGDGDIDGRRLASADAGIAQDQVESHAPRLHSPINLAVLELCGPILTRAIGGDETAQPWRWHDACSNLAMHRASKTAEDIPWRL